MRLFLAVNPGDQFRRELSLRVDPLRKQLERCQSLRWTSSKSWHLTLQFLGDWPDARVDGLHRALIGLTGESGFILKPGGLGAFPDLHQPRVLFLQLDSDGNAESLARVARKTVAAVWPDGPQDSKPFRAHLTLARVKGRLTEAELQTVSGLELAALPETTIGDFRLVKSVLRPTGAEHQDLAVVSLSGD